MASAGAARKAATLSTIHGATNRVQLVLALPFPPGLV